MYMNSNTFLKYLELKRRLFYNTVMGKYEFVRFNYVGHPDEGEKHWWFVAKTYEDVVEHTKKFFQPTMQEGFDAYAAKYIEFAKKINPDSDYIYVPHPDNHVEGAIRTIWAAKNNTTSAKPKPLDLFNTANNIYLEAFRNRINDVAKGPIYLEDGVRQFGYSEGNPHYEIVERVYSDTLEYPSDKPTYDKVKFIQWPGGKHWYAKIGHEDIVDKNGNQKWESRIDAEAAAYWYIKTYYG